MQEHGYDESKPIDVWKRATQDGFEYVLVDGFTRARAAKEIGRLTVMAYLHDFASVEEARDYAIHTQRDRRNLSDAEILTILSVIDEKVTGFKGRMPMASRGANGEQMTKTAQRTAREIGTSTRKVEKARRVISDPEMVTAVKRGDLSINKGYNTIRAREKAASALDGGEPVLEKSKKEPTPAPSLSVSKPIDFNVLVDRLRTKLGVEVELALEGMGESGRVSFCFANRDELSRVVEKICSSGVPTSTG